ncbi:MAG: DNA primase [Bacteroidales bacterium]|nr:DNA primase [Bacteroidales bacterium]
MIPKATVDKILDAAQIADVIGDFVTLKKSGADLVACCPFHNEKTPSFHVSPSRGYYKCFGCGKGGSAVNFVMEHETMTYVEALKYLANKYHIEVVEKEETAEEIAARQKNESLLLVTAFAAKFFADQLSTPEGRSVGYAYFKSRGLEDGTITKFGLGWAPRGRDTLSKAARAAGYKEDFLVETGLSVRRDDGSLNDRFYERAMFPICSDSGRVIAFGGRTLRSDKTVAKYVNSPESDIYVKSRTLYGIHLAKGEIVRQDKCLLVEGYLDVISMHQLGVTNVAASSGTSLTVEQVRLIRKYTSNVTIIYDGDSAGIHAALRGVGLVLREGLNVKVVLLPEGDDPDTFARGHTLDEVKAYIASHEQDFIGFKSDLLLGDAGDDPLKKANLVNDIADTIALIPDPVKRATYLESTSRKFNMGSDVIYQRIASTREALLEEERRQWEREREARRAEAEGGVPAGYDDYGPDGGSSATGGFNGGSGNGPSNGVVQSGGTVFNAPRLEPCEKELLGFILNSGQEVLKFDSDSEFYSEEPCDVFDFIDSALVADEQVFANDIYRKIYDLYLDCYEQGLSQEKIIARLMDGPDEDVARVTEDLVIPKYDLTVKKLESSITNSGTQLVTFVPRSILVYKRRLIEEKVMELTARLGEIPAEDVEGTDAVMVELRNLTEMKTRLNEKLGRRLRKNRYNQYGEEE